jgi:hypothetical protein
MRPRLRALARLLLPLAIALAAVSVGWSHANPPEKLRRPCRCPQTTDGWLLFPDSSPRTPDFWWQDEVVVQEILSCPHGLQFRFLAKERGNLHLVALVFTTAPARPYRDPARSRRALDLLEVKVKELMGGTLVETGRMDFRHLPEDQCPRILQPSRRLALEWQGQEVELRGYLDVYLTLLI